MSPSNSRRRSHGYTITALAAEKVSLPTPRAPIHDDIPIAPGGHKVSRPNPGELRHGSIKIASGGQEVSPSNSRADYYRDITSKFCIQNVTKTSTAKVRCLHFDLIR
jgi:hypothetical protein